MYQKRDAYLNIILQTVLERSGLERRDKALVTELVQGTVRMRNTLDWSLSKFTDRQIERLDPEILWILRLSAYQIMFMNVPDYAACSIGASLARKRKGRGGAAYVNAVMRAFSRGKSELSWPEKEKEPARYLETRYSCPMWIAGMWIDELGMDRAESLCEACNRPHPVALRCNLLKADSVDIMRSLEGYGFEVHESKLAPGVLLAKGGGGISKLEEYRRGLFSIQDEGSVLVGRALGVGPGMSVLDACAGPGGKANQMAELMKNKGRLLATDINPDRLSMVEREAERLGNTAVETMCLDARQASDHLEMSFDRILVDAPCTGLGTLSRRPDIRWRRRPEDVARLSQLQRELLGECSKLTRPGGLILYSTCTLSRQENHSVAEWFVSGNRGFEVVEAGGVEPGGTQCRYLELFPDKDGCDGMFAALFRRCA